MDKKKWIYLSIGIVVVVGVLALIKIIPFWATIVSLVAFLAGEFVGYKMNSLVVDSSVEDSSPLKDTSPEKTFVQEELPAQTTTVKATKKSKKSK